MAESPDAGPDACAAIEVLARGALRHHANQALRDSLRTGDTEAVAAFVEQMHRTCLGLLVLSTAAKRGLIDAATGFDESAAAAIDGLRNSVAPRTDEFWPTLCDALEQLGRMGLLAPAQNAARFALSNNDLMCAGSRLFDTRRGMLQTGEIGAQHEQLLGVNAEMNLDSESPEQVFRLSPLRSSRRRRSGSFYTPPLLVGHLLDVALEPVISRAVEGRSAAEAEMALLDLRVCDPSCGTGHFLMPSASRIANRLQAVRGESGEEAGHRRALRDVIANCIHGVDLDPIAVELCRTLLWLEAGDASFDPTALADRIKCGHALLGAAPAPTFDVEHARLIANAWCAALIDRELRITPKALREIERNPRSVAPKLRDAIARCAAKHRFFHWHLEFPAVFAAGRGGFDVVVGNPPFLNQLQSDTANARGPAAIMRERSAGAVRGYADVASAFLLLASEITRDGGMFALVQPQSLLAARDAAPVRRAILSRAMLRSLWVANEHLFEASVFTCAPAFERGPKSGSIEVTRFGGAEFAALPSIEIDAAGLGDESTWAHLAAAASNVPEFVIRDCGVVGDLASATADFRDQYYGLAGFLLADADLTSSQREDREAFPPLVTTGLIDLARNDWATTPTRVLKQLWLSPRIDRRRMEREGELGSWIVARLTPKIVLATQTRVMEVWVDERGEFVPSLPLISIMPRDAGRIWHIAAALASPVCAAIALRKWGGAAMTADAIKLSAKQVLQLPLPGEEDAWNDAARKLQMASESSIAPSQRAALLKNMAEATLQAYSVAMSDRDGLLRWWDNRMKPRSRGRPVARE